MNNFIAIDPGDNQSAFVQFGDGDIVARQIMNNYDLLHFLKSKIIDGDPKTLAIEMIASYGMPVGKSVFDTCIWVGRFIQAWDAYKRPYTLIYRKEVKISICGTLKAKDANIRQALIDRYGGKSAIGTKKNPGPLYGFAKDLWSALAVAETYRANH